MPRNTRVLPPSTAPPFRAHLAGGNGAVPNPEAERMAHIERLLGDFRKELDIQFKRIADLQAQVDRAAAEQKIAR